MTELQAARTSETLSAPRLEVISQRARYRDVVIALAAFAVLAALPLLFSSKALLDFVIRCSAFGLFATSLNLLVGYTGMISFGHGMFFGLGAYGFGLIMQRTGVPIPVAFVATLLITAIVATIIGAICVRLKEIYFAFVTLAFQMLIHSDHPVVVLASPAATRACAAASRARPSSASISRTRCTSTSRAARCW